jgi:hypothetical protein
VVHRCGTLGLFPGTADEQLDLGIPLLQIDSDDCRRDAHLRQAAAPDVDPSTIHAHSAVQIAVVQRVDELGQARVPAPRRPVDDDRLIRDQLIGGTPELLVCLHCR